MKFKDSAGLLAIFICASAHAQSSVTLYGVLDAGITYTSNISTASGHGSALQFQDGVIQPTQWGIKGDEDLGGGTHAIFDLENGFQLSNGALITNGSLFNRKAYVGLSGPWGRLTMGRDFDFIGETFAMYSNAVITPAGLLGWGLSSYASGGYILDNRVWGVQVSNAVKYLSPTFGGLSAGAMYAFGNVAGSLGTNQVMNFIINYSQKNFNGSASYFSQHNEALGANETVWAIGGNYTIGAFQVVANVATAALSSSTKPRATTLETGVQYSIRPDVSLSAGYTQQWRNNDLGSANTFILGADYILSKRTDVYAVGVLGHDHAYPAQVEAAFGSPSSSDTQSAVRVGLRHRF
ncbi:porin [Paraburkholderia guartelaensis]|uniref:Porin n=1 Tax=Paraburkholderia guartelaensis TaxID=2546446 RepID=A0A4R5L1J6_9BURK|nr:porin [Paraburkholderia guartelaensis]TDG01870.1 porin [Paraburkholderia guartelaensis]